MASTTNLEGACRCHLDMRKFRANCCMRRLNIHSSSFTPEKRTCLSSSFIYVNVCVCTYIYIYIYIYISYSPSAGEESESLRSRVPQILIFKYVARLGIERLKFLYSEFLYNTQAVYVCICTWP